MANPKVRKERNYLLDVFKVIAALLVIMFHFSLRLYPQATMAPYVVNPLAAAAGYQKATAFGPFANVMTMAFYTYTCGYWLIRRVHKEKKANLVGRGKDLSLVGKYFTRNVASYWPYLLFGVLWGIIGFFIAHPTLLQNPMNIFYGLKNSMYELMGIQSAGIMGYAENLYAHSCGDLSAMTNNYTDISSIFIQYNSPMWYLSAMICFAPIVYIIFMKSELAGIIFSIVVFSCGNGWMNVGGEAAEATANFLFIGKCAIRLLTPMMMGIWGYYLAEYIRKAELTDKGRNMVSLAGALGVVWFLYLMIDGSSQMMLSYPIFLILTMMFSEQGKITPAINKALAKLPLMNSLATLGLGIFVVHTPLLCIFKFRLLDTYFAGASAMQVWWVFIALVFALYIPFYFIDKFCLKKITKAISTFFKCNEPPVFDN